MDQVKVIETSAQAVIRQRIGEVATMISPEVLGEAMGDQLLERIPELAESADADFREALVLSCTSNVAAIKEGLLTGAPVEGSTPPPDATTWAHELVHRGMPLATLLRAYRLGHWLFEQTFEEASAVVDLDLETRHGVLAGASEYCFSYIDIICTQLVDEYETEREQWMRGAAAAQAELVQAIVGGETIEPREATATLRYTVSGTHLGFIVWRDRRARPRARASSPAALAKSLAAELGGTETLVVPIGENAAWAWTTGDLRADLPTRSVQLEGSAIAAVGTPHAGPAGMARTHHEARAARRMADIIGADAGAIVHHPTVALASLVCADAPAAVHFVGAELGELGADTDPARRLRETIRVFLDEKQSPSRTAHRLGIHQNTVSYRVKRAEEMLRRPIDERRLELEVALLLHDGLDALRAQGGGAGGRARGLSPRAT